MKNDTVTRKEIAKTIIAQLGGNRFAAMTGAKNFVSEESGLSFKLPSNFATKGINHVTITLTPADLYDVTFRKIRGVKVQTIATEEAIYFDMLRERFTAHTGLFTNL